MKSRWEDTGMKKPRRILMPNGWAAGVNTEWLKLSLECLLCSATTCTKFINGMDLTSLQKRESEEEICDGMNMWTESATTDWLLEHTAARRWKPRSGWTGLMRGYECVARKPRMYVGNSVRVGKMRSCSSAMPVPSGREIHQRTLINISNNVSINIRGVSWCLSDSKFTWMWPINCWR